MQYENGRRGEGCFTFSQRKWKEGQFLERPLEISKQQQLDYVGTFKIASFTFYVVNIFITLNSTHCTK